MELNQILPSILLRNNIIDKKFGKLYSQLFTWRQKGDYDDLFDFREDQVKEYFKPVEELISLIESLINK